LIPAITYIESSLLNAALLWAITVVLALVWLVFRSMRRRQLKEACLLFDESEELLISTVQLTAD
jgi:cytochrome c-type biogenesis protein CcmH/NrfF